MMVSQYSLYPATNAAHAPPGMRLRTVSMPREIYDSYVQLYNSAALLCHTLDVVLNHKDHQDVMDMGVSMGLCMPIERDFQAQNRILKEWINAFGPDEIETVVLNKKGGVAAVRVPFNTAVGFHNIAIETARTIAMVMNSFHNQDYQSCFRQLKEDGKPYQGPVSFNNVSKTWCVLIATCAAQTNHAPQEKLPSNWAQCAPQKVM